MEGLWRLPDEIAPDPTCLRCNGRGYIWSIQAQLLYLALAAFFFTVFFTYLPKITVLENSREIQRVFGCAVSGIICLFAGYQTGIWHECPRCKPKENADPKKRRITLLLMAAFALLCALLLYRVS